MNYPLVGHENRSALQCRREWWADRGRESPCGLGADQLEGTFAISAPAAAAVFRALRVCGRAAETSWLKAAEAVPGHVLRAWGVLRFVGYERRAQGLKRVLERAADPDRLAFLLSADGHLDSDALAFLKRRKRRDAEAYPLVADRLPAPYASRLARDRFRVLEALDRPADPTPLKH
jgi:hypothetical protein